MATLVDSYTVLPTSDATALYNASTYDSVGQSFDSGAGGNISTAKCYCHTNGRPTGSVYAKLYAHSGTFGTSSVGTGAALATSDAVDITTIGSVDEWVEFTFTSTYEMAASTKYVIMFYYQGGDSSNKLWVMGEGTTASHGGNRVRHTAAGAWAYSATNECLFEVYSEASGGSVVVSTTTDSLGLTENSADVNLNVSVNASTDSLAITAYDAGIKADTTFTASTDALTLTEQAADVVLAINISADKATLTLTEYAAGIKADTSIAASCDALALTEHNAALSADINVAASCDELTLTEQAANVNSGINVSADSASLSVTAYDAAIDFDVSVSAAFDSLTLTAHNAAVKVDNNILASCDVLTLTANSQTVKLNVNVEATYDLLRLRCLNAAIVFPPAPSIETDWKAYKGDAATWINGFVEQPNKWGYLNNPEWTDEPSDPVNYDYDVENEPVVWPMTHRRF